MKEVRRISKRSFTDTVWIETFHFDASSYIHIVFLQRNGGRKVHFEKRILLFTLFELTFAVKIHDQISNLTG